ncbi:MAG: sugar ABC transporter permease [Chelatococcus sp.]|nr:sugar ABC transporter permease [Chelatococcus sp. YT9]MBS7700485.1 sugar ABC transporter permease [Chelatococcus sp. YT9]MBX3556281.1 sugar ABC transporter permease [Chelatococcus sp.]
MLVAPAILALAVTVAYPILYNVYISLFDWNILDSDAPEQLVGLGNYRTILADPGFLHSLWITASFTIVAVGIEFVLGLSLAMLVNEQIYGRRLVRTLLVAPVMATPIVVGLIFKVLWHAEFGVVNYLLALIGLGPVHWLSEPTTAFIALLITEVWHNTAFVFLVMLGALQMLPAEPYEAAVVDGASLIQRFRYVTLPLLRPAILVALLFRLVFTIRLFDEVWALTRGGPQSATETISILIYKSAFEQFRMGYAAALSILLLILTAILALILIRVLYRSEPT